MRFGNFKITQNVRNIQRIEYISELASIYPIHRDSTVIVVDLSDPKFILPNPKTGECYTLDHLISDAVRNISLDCDLSNVVASSGQ